MYLDLFQFDSQKKNDLFQFERKKYGHIYDGEWDWDHNRNNLIIKKEKLEQSDTPLKSKKHHRLVSDHILDHKKSV